MNTLLTAQTEVWEKNCQPTTVANFQISQINNRDEQLKQLAKKAQQHPPLSCERRLALTKLVNGILQSGKLCHPQKSRFSAAVYQDIYDEALQELLLYVCQNIHKYEPERGAVMTWINVLLSMRFFKQAVHKRVHQFTEMIVTDLDNLAQPKSQPQLTEIFQEYIESDPENIFKKEYVKSYPQVNFQALAQRRIQGKPWKEISAEFGIKLPTISAFYQRSLKKFSLKFKEYCINNVT